VLPPVFASPELVALTLAVVAINGWDRLATGLHRSGTTPPPAHRRLTSSGQRLLCPLLEPGPREGTS
jgi:hypothetical protein